MSSMFSEGDVAIACLEAEQEADLEQQEQRYFEIAGRLHSLVIDGKLDPSDFEDILIAMGILTDWKRSHT